MQKEVWKNAYEDYRKGVSYADIAKKYKVSLATVKSWYTRHFKSMQAKDNLRTEEAKVCESEIDSMRESTQQQPAKPAKPVGTSLSKLVGTVVAKHVKDIQPESLLACDVDFASKLTDRQHRFVREYLIDRIGKSAAIRCGYSPNDAAVIASRLLSDVNVASCIAKAEAERDKRTGLNADLIDIEIARILRLNPSDVIDLETGKVREDASPDDLACIQSIKVKRTPMKGGGYMTEYEVKLMPKDRIFELAMKRHNMMPAERKQIDIHQQISGMTKEEREKEINELLAKREENTVNITPVVDE